jgi:hypothetical protein
MEGGVLAGKRDALARSTVSFSTVAEGTSQLDIDYCSGVLIARNVVLTAAHCVSDDPLAAIVHVYDGSRPTGKGFRVSTIVRYAVPPGDVPPEYASLVRFSLDTALLRLSSPVEGRNSIPIANSGGVLPDRLTIAGAGLSGQTAGTLKIATLVPLARTDTGIIIARSVGARICLGDSGSPVVANTHQGPVLWGIASAVLTNESSCGQIVVIAPARPHLSG